MSYSASATLYTIDTPDLEGDDIDVEVEESQCVTRGIKFFTDNFLCNKKIHSVIVDTVDYNDRIKWVGGSIYYKDFNGSKKKKKAHSDLVNNTNFEFRSNILNSSSSGQIASLVLEYMEYVKDLNFCQIFGYLSIEFIELEENKITIICEMDAESG